jgi:hypothetical protein
MGQLGPSLRNVRGLLQSRARFNGLGAAPFHDDLIANGRAHRSFNLNAIWTAKRSIETTFVQYGYQAFEINVRRRRSSLFHSVNEIEPQEEFGMENEMKKLMTAVALLTAIATPVFAQSFDPDIGTGNVRSFEYMNRFNKGATMVYTPTSSSTYAQAPDVVKGKAPGLVSGHVRYHGD